VSESMPVTLRCCYTGCTETHTSSEPPASNATFTCKRHAVTATSDARFQPFQFDKALHRDYNYCRPVFGNTKPQIITADAFPAEDVPDWSRSDAAIQKLLLRAFPRLASDEKQRNQASRWATVIHLHYRLRWTEGQIAEAMAMTVSAFQGVIDRIKKAASPERKPRGRPRLPPDTYKLAA
jgi:hypothetical protein